MNWGQLLNNSISWLEELFLKQLGWSCFIVGFTVLIVCLAFSNIPKNTAMILRPAIFVGAVAICYEWGLKYIGYATRFPVMFLIVFLALLNVYQSIFTNYPKKTQQVGGGKG